MGVRKKTRKFAQTKRVLGRRDARHAVAKAANDPAKLAQKKKEAAENAVRHVQQAPSSLYFQHNDALVPPYNIILDSNFFVHTVRNKIDVMEGLMDALLAKCNPVVTECTISELEKLGSKFRLALRLAKDERWKRLTCSHTDGYADDCIVDTTTKNRIYLVGTNDGPLRRRLRAIPGVPLVAVGRGKYTVERLPNATF